MMPGSPRWWNELGLLIPGATGNGLAAPQGTTVAPARPAAARTGMSRPAREPGPLPAAVAAAAADPQREARIASLSIEALAAAVEACAACSLRQGRQRSVAGAGTLQADWMFVGEGPGVEEDLAGHPFAGPAGLLLDSMLAALGLQRTHKVFLSNAVKCRPPAGRNPDTTECAACRPFLEREIALVRPRIIVALGRTAAQSLLGGGINLGSLRGKVHQCRGIPVVVTYPPDYLLRNLPEKAKAWADLCLAKRQLSS